MAEVALHPEARRDYRGAVAWYRQQDPASARRRRDDGCREAMISRFPYAVIYRVEASGDVLILAIAHASRDPDDWHGRA